MEASRPRSIAALRLLLRTAACARSAEATAIISTTGHSPLKARRVVRPPTHVHEGKMKLPTSKLSTSSQDSQPLSSLGREKPAVGVAGSRGRLVHGSWARLRRTIDSHADRPDLEDCPGMGPECVSCGAGDGFHLLVWGSSYESAYTSGSS